MLISESQEEIRLEAVTQTDIEGVCGGFPFNRTCLGVSTHLILHVGGYSVDVSALAKRIVVSNANDITLKIQVRGRSIN